MRRSMLLVLATLLLVPAPAAAQLPADLYEFDLTTTSNTRIDVPLGGTEFVDIVFHDRSADGFAAPDGGGVTAFPHDVRFRVNPSQTAGGWNIVTPPSIQTYGGQSYDLRMQVKNSMPVSLEFYAFNLTALISVPGQPEMQRSIEFVAYTPGASQFTALPPFFDNLAPQEIVHGNLRLLNGALLPRTFSIEVASNPCDLPIAIQNEITVQPGTQQFTEVPLSLSAPAEKFWYQGEGCSVALAVAPTDNPDMVQTVLLSVQVQGFYVAPEWVFWTLLGVILVGAFLLFLKRRKERLEEEIFGKPQKPWTIPVEEVYLKHLRQRDERAWYMVRHHLMEEEYQSALLWHKHYRKATRGTHAKERLVLRQERELERWRSRWQKRIAKPERKVARLERRLQKKLDRAADKAHKKALRKHKADVARIEKAHAKKVARAQEQHEKAVKKAAKKGAPEPPAPSVAPPDLPPEPVQRPVRLSEHRLQRKVDKAHRKAVRRQGNLEVRFERKDARRLAKLRRKARRIAKRINDPDFVAEHPLLHD